MHLVPLSGMNCLTFILLSLLSPSGKTYENEHTGCVQNSQLRQEPQPTGKTKWATTLKFGKILGATSVVRKKQNPQNVVRCKIHTL